jgi:hypothetical protein
MPHAVHFWVRYLGDTWVVTAGLWWSYGTLAASHHYSRIIVDRVMNLTSIRLLSIAVIDPISGVYSHGIHPELEFVTFAKIGIGLNLWWPIFAKMHRRVEEGGRLNFVSWTVLEQGWSYLRLCRDLQNTSGKCANVGVTYLKYLSRKFLDAQCRPCISCAHAYTKRKHLSKKYHVLCCTIVSVWLREHAVSWVSALKFCISVCNGQTLSSQPFTP